MATIVFKCPLCGAPFEFTEGDHVSLCQFCGATSAIAGDTGIPRLLIPERIDLNDARAALRKLLANEGGSEFAASFNFKGGTLYFLPYWRIHGKAIGWQWSERETYSEEVDYDEKGARYTRQVKGPNERIFSLIAKPLDFASPAGDFTVFGRVRAGLAGSVLKCEVMDYPSAAARGVVVDPLKGVAQARQEALAMSLESAGAEGSIRRESRVKISSEWLSLLYYPVWSLQFARGDSMYPVVVDAVNGEVVKCHFPLEKERKCFLPLALISLILLGWTTMPVAGVAFTLLAAFIFKWQTGSLEISDIVKLLTGIPERGAGVKRG